MVKDVDLLAEVRYTVGVIKICECGAEFTTYPSKLKTGRGKYCSRACSDKHTLIKPGQTISLDTQYFKGQVPHNYKGWRLTKARKNGKYYKLIHVPNHPHATKAGYVREHRLVMEKELGRYLEPWEVVNHIKEDETLNNDVSNLEVMPKVEHDRMNTPLNIHRRWQS